MRSFGRFAIGAEDINRGNDRILYISNEFGDWAGEYRSICRGQRSIIYFGKSFKACRALCLLRSAVFVSNTVMKALSDVPGTPMLEVVKGWKHLLKGEYASKRDFEFVLIGREHIRNKQI